MSHRHKAAREMCLERSVQEPYSCQHLCKLGRTRLAEKAKPLRLLHCPGKGEKESQADMRSFVSGTYSEVMWTAVVNISWNIIWE